MRPCDFKVDVAVLVVVEGVLDHFQAEEVPSWDPDFCGDKLVLRDNSRSISNVHYGGFKGAQSAQPCSRYSVHVVNGQNIMIGFAPRLGFQKNKSNFEICGWFIRVASGSLWAQDGTRGKAYGTAIPVGSVVTAFHDTIQHTIEFEVNGESLGIAYTNISHAKLFAAVDIYYNSEIRIIDSYN